MTYWKIFSKLFFFFFLAGVLAVVPTVITTGIIFGFYPSLLFLMIAPTGGFFLSIPSVFIIAAVFTKYGPKIPSIFVYAIISALLSALITGILCNLLLPGQMKAVFVQFLYVGAIAGALYGWRMKKALLSTKI